MNTNDTPGNANARTVNEVIQCLIYSSGAVLLFLSLMMFIGNFSSSGLVWPNDPLTTISMQKTFWVIALLELGVGLFCLFGTSVVVQLGLVFWLSLNFILYQIGFLWLGVSGGLRGNYGGISTEFGISVSTADIIMKILFSYLLLTSLVALLWSRLGKQSFWVVSDFLKTFCPACGGHIKFSSRNVGEKTNCPHCEKPVTLRQPDEALKMSCFFCQGHVQFPAHALGTKMPCPHCKKDITLVEQKS